MKAKEVLKLLKISRVTLYKYVKSGKIRVTQMPNSLYLYNREDVYRLANIKDEKLNVIYARVSTHKQKQDLKNQIENTIAFLNAKGIKVDKVYEDIKSGMTLDRKGFMELLDDVMQKRISVVYIAYKDRLARLSYDLVEKLFNDNGARIEIINSCENKALEQELFEDIMQTIHSFSMKMYSKRRLANKLLNESKANENITKSWKTYN